MPLTGTSFSVRRKKKRVSFLSFFPQLSFSFSLDKNLKYVNDTHFDFPLMDFKIDFKEIRFFLFFFFSFWILYNHFYCSSFFNKNRSNAFLYVFLKDYFKRCSFGKLWIWSRSLSTWAWEKTYLFCNIIQTRLYIFIGPTAWFLLFSQNWNISFLWVHGLYSLFPRLFQKWNITLVIFKECWQYFYFSFALCLLYLA